MPSVGQCHSLPTWYIQYLYGSKLILDPDGSHIGLLAAFRHRHARNGWRSFSWRSLRQDRILNRGYRFELWTGRRALGDHV